MSRALLPMCSRMDARRRRRLLPFAGGGPHAVGGLQQHGCIAGLQGADVVMLQACVQLEAPVREAEPESWFF
jgi:hypothetical protein